MGPVQIGLAKVWWVEHDPETDTYGAMREIDCTVDELREWLMSEDPDYVLRAQAAKQQERVEWLNETR